MNYYGQFEGSVEGEAAAEAAPEIAADGLPNITAEDIAAEGVTPAVAPEGTLEDPQKQSVTIESGGLSVAD